jgi:hypothetical protein
MKMHSSILLLLGVVGLSAPMRAGMLKQAEVTAVINEVKLVVPGKAERPADVRDVVSGSSSIKTGIKSRAELLFQDKTLTRLGANTLFSFDEGTRDLELEHGTMLLQAPKGIGGARIRTAAVTAAITGTTILLEYSPAVWKRLQPPGVSELVAAMTPEQCALELDHPTRKYSAPELAEIKRKAKIARKAAGHVKVMVLEGTLRLYLNNRVGESVLVKAGELVVLGPNATTIPPSVSFDIARLAETSLLVNNKFWGGSGTELRMAAVSREIAEQEKLKQQGALSDSGLKIIGGGTQIVFGDVLAQVERGQTANFANFISPPSEKDQPPPGDASTQGSGAPPPGHPGPSESATPLELAGFSVEGSSTSTTADAPPTSTNVTGNVKTFTKLDGAVDVLPTQGTAFTLLSTAGTVGDVEGAEPRSASRAVRVFDFAPVPAPSKSYLTFDYRFLTKETNQPGSFADEFEVKITNGTRTITYTLDRDALSPGGNGNLTPLAQANVGGFDAGTDWLPFKIDITAFAGTSTAVSFLVYDRGDPVVDSAVALDGVKVVTNPTSPTRAALPGRLTLSLDSVTLGSAAAEDAFTIPDLEGQPARNGVGPAADAGSFFVKTAGGLTLEAPINASTGANGAGTPAGGKGGTVNFESTGGEVSIKSTIKVSESSSANGKASAAGGSIKLHSGRTTGPAITISNSGELLALLNAGIGGKVEVSSNGGEIRIDGKVVADHGTIDVRNPGNINGVGSIQLTGAQLSADIVKVGALGTAGQLTITAGSLLNAANSLKLYGGADTGRVLFNGNGTVTLNGSQIDIAAKTVEIDAATHVQNNGDTRVHADSKIFGIGAGGGKFQNPVSGAGVAGRPQF